MTRARVLLLTAALGPLDYRVPRESEAPLGSVVIAPLGPRRLGGVVWEDESFGAPEAVGDNRLRNLYEVVPVPPVPAPLRRLVEWTSDYYLAPPGAVLRMVLPGVAFADARRPIVEYRATGELPARMTPQRTVAMEAIGERQGMVRELAALAEVSDAVIRGLINTGAL
ncbi:MAG: primosomal protein N', partial [Sphingomonadales bacterium]